MAGDFGYQWMLEQERRRWAAPPPGRVFGARREETPRRKTWREEIKEERKARREARAAGWERRRIEAEERRIRQEKRQAELEAAVERERAWRKTEAIAREARRLGVVGTYTPIGEDVRTREKALEDRIREVEGLPPIDRRVREVALTPIIAAQREAIKDIERQERIRGDIPAHIRGRKGEPITEAEYKYIQERWGIRYKEKRERAEVAKRLDEEAALHERLMAEARVRAERPLDVKRDEEEAAAMARDRILRATGKERERLMQEEQAVKTAVLLIPAVANLGKVTVHGRKILIDTEEELMRWIKQEAEEAHPGVRLDINDIRVRYAIIRVLPKLGWAGVERVDELAVGRQVEEMAGIGWRPKEIRADGGIIWERIPGDGRPPLTEEEGRARGWTPHKIDRFGIITEWRAEPEWEVGTPGITPEVAPETPTTGVPELDERIARAPLDIRITIANAIAAGRVASDIERYLTDKGY